MRTKWFLARNFKSATWYDFTDHVTHIHSLTFVSHLEVAEVEFLEGAVSQQPQLEHEEAVVPTLVEREVELPQGAGAWLGRRGGREGREGVREGVREGGREGGREGLI